MIVVADRKMTHYRKARGAELDLNAQIVGMLAGMKVEFSEWVGDCVKPKTT